MMEKISADGLISRFGGKTVEEAIANAEARGVRIIRPSTTGARLGREVKLAGRNSPCPCGGGKKYKRCCLPRIWRERYGK